MNVKLALVFTTFRASRTFLDKCPSFRKTVLQRQAHNTHGNGDIGTSVPRRARSGASTRHHHPGDIALSLTHMSCHSSPSVLPSSSRNDGHGSRTFGTSDHGTEDDARTPALGACTNPRFRGFQKFVNTCAQGDLRNTANDTFTHTQALCAEFPNSWC